MRHWKGSGTTLWSLWCGKLRPLDQRNGGLSAANWFIRTPNSGAACCPKMALWSAMRWHSDRRKERKETTFQFIFHVFLGLSLRQILKVTFGTPTEMMFGESTQLTCFVCYWLGCSYCQFCTLATVSAKQTMNGVINAKRNIMTERMSHSVEDVQSCQKGLRPGCILAVKATEVCHPWGGITVQFHLVQLDLVTKCRFYIIADINSWGENLCT